MVLVAGGLCPRRLGGGKYFMGRAAMEIEYKFKLRDEGQIAQILGSALVRLRGGRAEFTPQIQADTFHDTADRRLLVRKYALRLRRRGNHRTVTLKNQADPSSALEGLHRRQEWETVVFSGIPHPSNLPEGELKRRLLELTGGGALQELFTQSTARHQDVLELGEGTRVELCLDITRGAARGREWSYCEAELELREGKEKVLVAFAREFAECFGLEAEPLSKFARGLRALGLLP